MVALKKFGTFELYKIVNKFSWLGRLYQYLGSMEFFRPLIYFVKELDNQRYRGHRLKFYGQFVKKGDLVFDIGANIGNRVEILNSLGCSIIAVEPQKHCLDYMKKKFGSKGNIILLDNAVAEKVEQRDLFVCGSDASSSLSKAWISSMKRDKLKHLDWNKTVKVSTTTLDEMIKNYGKPAFCKIDVEGYELNVLKGLSKPIQCVSFEFATEFLNDVKKCIQHLLTLGTVKFNYSFGESMELASETWISAKELITILESLPDRAQGDIYARFSTRVNGR